MDRQKLLLILATVGIGGALIGAVMFFSSMKTPTSAGPTPTPTVTIDTGEAPAPQPSATPSDEPSPSPSNTVGWQDGHVHYPGDGHDHGHDHGPVTDCDSGPVACEGDNAEAPILRNTDEELIAADAVRGQIAPFVMQWATLAPDEAADARAERLRNAGAADAVATQTTQLARADSGQVGLTATAKPMTPNRILFLGSENGLLAFQVALNVNAEYTLVDGSGSFRVVGGQIYVLLSPEGRIERVVENFPTLRNLR